MKYGLLFLCTFSLFARGNQNEIQIPEISKEKLLKIMEEMKSNKEISKKIGHEVDPQLIKSAEDKLKSMSPEEYKKITDEVKKMYQKDPGMIKKIQKSLNQNK